MKKISIFLMLAIAVISANATNAYLKVTPNMSPEASKYAISALNYSQITAIETTVKGRLWASILGGGDSPEGFLTLSYSDSNGKSWVEHNLALDARAEKLAVRNGVLWRSPSGEMWLFYAVFDGYYDGRGSMWAMVCKDPDAKKPVWEAPIYLGVGIPTGRPVVNQQGEWLLPTALWGRDVMTYDRALFIASEWERPRFVSPYADKYHELDSKRGAGLYISRDNGASWSEHLGVVKCQEEAVEARYNNPQMFVHSDGSVRMVVRTSGTSWSYVATSQNGVEWSAPARFVSAPDQNFAVYRLSDGKLLMVRNARFDKNAYWYPEGMYAYLSEDCGATWYGGLRIATDNKTINPVVAEGAKGEIYIITHHDPEIKSENQLFVTSVAEIDAANADYENNPKNKQVVLTVQGAGAAFAAETNAITAPKTDWANETLRIATYNIQYPIMNWPERCIATVALIKDYKFDVFGSQEPHLPQIEDMMKHIGDEYAWVGQNVSGDNNDRKHHFNPIFYRKERVELLDYSTVWLSDKACTPGYGARSARLFTWAKFRDKRTGKEFFLFNGHYDHRGYEARDVASYIVLDMIRKVAKGMPSFVSADYNSDGNSEAYRVLQSSVLLKDTMLATDNAVNKHYQSHTNYQPAEKLKANGRHIDHLFHTPNSVKINRWELIIKAYNGKYGSDHLPICVDCLIAN
jgi:endonuclease/exonuclease/phosphatase family metal-dependent hydrolase